MKTTLLVPLALLTRSAAIPTRKGERKWRRGIEYYRQHEKVEHAKHLRRRIKWIGALGMLAKGGEHYDDEEEEAYDLAAYDVTAAATYEDERRLAVNASMSGLCPPEDVVTCVDGFATSAGNVTYAEGNVTCQVACDGECCVGVNEVDSSINSCTGFNGKVCKSGDIPSCSDNRTSGDDLGKACYRANIDEVVNGCNGREACASAGSNGDLGRVVNGCHGGDQSCFAAAAFGYIEEIVDSCTGKGACASAAVGGDIGYIKQGCQGVEACTLAAFQLLGILYACNNISACYQLANGDNGFDSIDSAVVSCCNGASECTGRVVQASGLPDQCGTSSPTSSPTTEVRILSHALYIICFTSNVSYQSLTIDLFIFRP